MNARLEPALPDASGPPCRAATLAYAAVDRQAGRAPRVTAKGSGWLAEEIIERARGRRASARIARTRVAAHAGRS